MWIYNQQSPLEYLPRDLTKASIVHIALSDPMTGIDQQRATLGEAHVLSPPPKSPL